MFKINSRYSIKVDEAFAQLKLGYYSGDFEGQIWKLQPYYRS